MPSREQTSDKTSQTESEQFRFRRPQLARLQSTLTRQTTPPTRKAISNTVEQKEQGRSEAKMVFFYTIVCTQFLHSMIWKPSWIFFFFFFGRSQLSMSFQVLLLTCFFCWLVNRSFDVITAILFCALFCT